VINADLSDAMGLTRPLEGEVVVLHSCLRVAFAIKRAANVIVEW